MGYRLSISDDRLAHMRNVGRRAQLIAKQVGVESQEELEDAFLLGYLHDIGYEFANDQSEHERIGGDILRRNGFRYWQEVRNHGNPDSAYSSVMLDILNVADMLTNSKGESVTFEERLSDIEKRYGKESHQHSKASRLVEQLVVKGYSFANNEILSEREAIERLKSANQRDPN